jgi:peptidoglycan-associated lipoprotein
MLLISFSHPSTTKNQRRFNYFLFGIFLAVSALSKVFQFQFERRIDMSRKTTGLIVPLVIICLALVISGCGKKSETPVIGEEETKVAKEESAQKEPEVVPEKAEIEKMLKDVNFDYDKHDIRPQDAEILKGNADLLTKYSAVKVRVEGHCDERGTNEYNLALGERRANSVKNYIVSLGVEAGRISTISRGEENPLSAGHNEEAWAKNRRGHFLVVAQ